MTNDEMASSEMRKWKEEEERKHIEENVMLTEASEKKIATVSITNDDIPKPTELKEDSEPRTSKETPPPSETPSKTVVIPTELDKQREEQIAALLKLLPATPPAPKREEREQNGRISHIEPKEPEQPPSSASSSVAGTTGTTKETAKEPAKEPVKEPVKERFSLPVRLDAECAIAIAMPSSPAIHFVSSVIQSPSDIEVSSVLLDKTVLVMGRMNVSVCDAYWSTCKENPSYDVVWWRLELAKESSE